MERVHGHFTVLWCYGFSLICHYSFTNSNIVYSTIFWYAHVFFCLFYSKAQQDVKEPHVLIAKQPKQRYGEEIKMANQFVMLVVFITNCTM